MKRVLLLIAASFVAPSACGGDTGGVTMTGHEFQPSSLSVSVGEVVVWTNGGDESHTVTAYDESVPSQEAYFSSGGFDSEDEARGDVAGALVTPDETFEFTFEEPGTYRYFCIPHEDDGMKGTISVE